MKGFKTIIFSIFVGAAIIVGCKSEKKDTQQTPTRYEEEEDELPYGVTDSINGEKVSTQCAKMNYELEQMQDQVEAVKSPDMLLRLRAKYQHDLDSITKGSDALTAEEKSIVESQREKLNAKYAEACKGYVVPAEGVIQNLKDCIDRVNAAQSAEELKEFMSCRLSMLDNLDYIYLCVESNSTKIDEVKSLAHKLKNALYDKKVQFNMFK